MSLLCVGEILTHVTFVSDEDLDVEGFDDYDDYGDYEDYEEDEDSEGPQDDDTGEYMKKEHLK